MNTEQVKAKHSISSLFIFLLIAIYTVFVLLLVLISVGAYRNRADDARNTAQIRTSLGYIANKVRAADQVGGVSIVEWQGFEALLIREWHDGAEYHTRIYATNGGLYEHFVFAGDELALEKSLRIADIAALDMQKENGLLSLLLHTETGQALPLHIRLHASIR
ncbi:MAG: DUF4860 domain-containing protein [Clostridia bacterium]|nr:DUF4860 domain-containing protein [Clostridia bacterium]